ncbi:PLDc N-terminal domain-containing protein [Granulicella aggregans]|uniref:PLDc N-terminal domain-containing protein n=1 Tax=Granulicella aggregans TaxID=474949 RepID=UPI0021DF9DC6|nr:PLDc N-terminal domain-containing protein [Granulicella aggregans]
MSYTSRFRLMSVAAALSAVVIPQLGLAQRRGYSNANDADGILGCLGSLIVVPIIFVVVNIALLVWVNKDAKTRGMETPVIWMLLVLFTSFIGLIIYLLSRPKGNLASCPRCGHKKLSMLVKCPHCGAAV